MGHAVESRSYSVLNVVRETDRGKQRVLQRGRTK